MALQCTDLELSYPDGDGRLVVLDRVSMQVAPGEVVAVMGASGSGKSSLMAVAGLLRRPDGGSVKIGGVEADFADSRALARLRRDKIGLIFQGSNLFPALTAMEQLLLVAHMSGRVRSEDKSRAAELLESVGLGSKLAQRPSALSGGERQRVGIARALMGHPAVLLADEPTASLDRSRGTEVMALLVDQARSKSVAAVVVTHEQEIAAMADRSLRLEGGALISV